MNIMQNNSEEMKTIVETFIIEETAPLIYDGEQLEKWDNLIQELGLTGQQSIKQPNKSPIPFMYMKDNMVNIFNTLCPIQVDVENYSKTPIPLEIVELIALSKKEGYFDEMKIWYDDKSPDPCCVGINKRYGQGDDYTYKTFEEAQKVYPDLSKWAYQINHYLLGKWADVKHSFAQLAEMATARWTKEQRATFESYIKNYEQQLGDLHQTAEQRFSI